MFFSYIFGAAASKTVMRFIENKMANPLGGVDLFKFVTITVKITLFMVSELLITNLESVLLKT